MYSADRIIAVSPHYSEEILTPEFGCGLDDFLKTRKNVISGILNGLDTERWNPKTDANLSQNYDQQSLALRKKNKQALQKQFNLDIKPETPLLTIVSRMDPQKGIDIALRGLAIAKMMIGKRSSWARASPMSRRWPSNWKLTTPIGFAVSSNSMVN